jgi:hypothetical protein
VANAKAFFVDVIAHPHAVFAGARAFDLSAVWAGNVLDVSFFTSFFATVLRAVFWSLGRCTAYGSARNVLALSVAAVGQAVPGTVVPAFRV